MIDTFLESTLNSTTFPPSMPHSTVIPVRPLSQAFTARVPGSKSITNRALIAAALSETPVTLRGPLSSEDTDVAMAAMKKLGVNVSVSEGSWTVDGRSFGQDLGNNSDKTDFYLANAGTAVRFLSAVLCAKGLPCRVHGTERMHQRPIELLLQGLRDLGGDIQSELNTGCPPLLIGTAGLRGGQTEISGQVSSQFFSGLMMAAPFAKSESTINVSDEWLSLPYIEMTATMLKEFGIESNIDHQKGSITISAPQTYRGPKVYDIEPDATAATYPMGLGVLHGVPMTLEGLDRSALQGDVAFVDALVQMGCEVKEENNHFLISRSTPLKAIQMDLNNIPDAAMTVAVLCSVAEGKSQLTGLKNLAFKECDRLQALATELNKMGAKVEAHADGFNIQGIPLSSLKGANIETYHDHRMAMCLSLLGTLVEGVNILNPSCVQKTYPNYWEDLQQWCDQGSAS
jgi:3-phosphoshikimate 1-carboxyvinyltransferase